jgi:hypothetical protein
MVKKRHSRVCPCNEHIKVQTKFFGNSLSQLGNEVNLKKRKKLLKKCDPCFIRFLAKCATGVLHSAIKLPKKTYKTLQGDKKFLLSLVKPSFGVEAKRSQLLKHSGSGFIPLLARIAATVLETILP